MVATLYFDSSLTLAASARLTLLTAIPDWPIMGALPTVVFGVQQ
jgi:hypothetical protein